MILETFYVKIELVNNATEASLKQKKTCNTKCEFDSVDQGFLLHLSVKYDITGI